MQEIAPRSVVLVEGTSDQYALEALARRLGRDLDVEAVSIVSMGRSKNIGRFLAWYGPQGGDVRLAGLCDEAEESDFRRAIERAGLGSNLTRTDLERLGFYVCIADLEDELIRSLGAAAVERVIDDQGELGPFRTFQKQPEWRGHRPEQQLRRFMGRREWPEDPNGSPSRRRAGSQPCAPATGAGTGARLTHRDRSRRP
jgi:hypothetical protein